LVSANLPECNSSGPVPMRLLHTTCRRCTLSGCFGCQLLARGFTTSRFTGSLLCTCHCRIELPYSQIFE
jgi:hypothetical protein